MKHRLAFHPLWLLLALLLGLLGLVCPALRLQRS
jgi:hypothetical protein